MRLEQEFARIISFFLWRHQAVEVREQEPFQLASGLYSPIYINCRSLISYPGPREIVISFAEYLYHEREMNADGIAGGETAGIPFGAWLAQRLDKPFVLRAQETQNLRHQLPSRGFPTGRILLFEDLITDGLSKVGFVDALREADCMVSDCL